jgi:hypothetical protein
VITAAKIAAVFHMDPVVVLAGMPEWVPVSASPSYLTAIRIAAHNIVKNHTPVDPLRSN